MERDRVPYKNIVVTYNGFRETGWFTQEEFQELREKYPDDIQYAGIFDGKETKRIDVQYSGQSESRESSANAPSDEA